MFLYCEYTENHLDKSCLIYEAVNDSAPELENSSLPFTEYEVQILDFLKGNLEVGSIVPVLKLGGLSKDNQEIILLSEEDSLLSEGDVVIFVTPK